MALRVIWQYMDRSVTKKILYGPQKVTDRSIYCHKLRSIYCYMTLSAMNYLLYITFIRKTNYVIYFSMKEELFKSFLHYCL